MAFQSLYRRYRPARFGELVGQAHVVTALRNAVAEDRVGHAYLFSGPRGTGKTSTARILGKALNCTDLGEDGEPCCACESCQAFEAGASYDLHELDAASNNGVEAVRDLIGKVALGSPGRTKVYILDEVHMLTAGAENALLKTLEEPPDHVVFVLATTEPHKVVPTIRSRTQHYEFELIPISDLEAHVRYVVADAGLDVDDSMIRYVLRAGGGSARDTLSALDQVVAARGVPRDDDAVDGVVRALAARDAGAVVTAVSEALKAGRDPRVIGEDVLSRLREAFLSAMNAPLDQLSADQAATAAEIAETMPPAAITRALEVVGSALVDMRQAPDPRVDLEVALLRLCRPELDADLAAVLERIERLEQLQGQAPPPAPAGEARPAAGARAVLASRREEEQPAPGEPAAAEPAPAGARAALGAHRGRPRSEPDTGPPPAEAAEPPPAEPAPEVAEPAPASAGEPPGLAEVQAAWDGIRSTLPGRARSRFSGGRFVGVQGTAITFGLPNPIHRDRCQECADDVRRALSDHFGTALELELIVDGDAPAPPARAAEPGPPPRRAEPDDAAGDAAEEEAVDLGGLTDADAATAGGVSILTDAFPGAELIESDSE